MKQGKNISFYIEIVLMLIISVLAITILANAFSRSDLNSRKAKHLSDAVTLAASGAEAFLASSSEEDLLKVLNEEENAFAEDGVTAYYDDDLNPSADGKMKMNIRWDEADGFVNGTVTVYYGNEAVYDLETGFSKEAQ